MSSWTKFSRLPIQKSIQRRWLDHYNKKINENKKETARKRWQKDSMF